MKHLARAGKYAWEQYVIMLVNKGYSKIVGREAANWCCTYVAMQECHGKSSDRANVLKAEELQMPVHASSSLSMSVQVFKQCLS